MSNVATLQNTIDLKTEQMSLIDAEDISLQALEKYSEATLAFLSMMRRLNVSIHDPVAKEILASIPGVMEHAVTAPETLSKCHKLAERLVKRYGGDDVVMTGGTPKGPLRHDESPQFG